MANKISKRPPSGHRSARRKTAQRDETPIYFGGSSGLQGMQAPALPSLAEYIPLDRMDVHARRQLFGSWLDIVYLNGTDDYEYVRDVPAIEDSALVLQFTKEYRGRRVAQAQPGTLLAASSTTAQGSARCAGRRGSGKREK